MKLDGYWETFLVSGKISDYLDCKMLQKIEALDIQKDYPDEDQIELKVLKEMKQEKKLEKKQNYMVESDAGFC